MKLAARVGIGLLLLGILFLSFVALLHTGLFGLTVFVMHPYALGALACWVVRPAGRSTAGWCGFGAIMAAASVLFVSGIDGAICIAMSLPLTIPLAIMGARRMHRSLSEPYLARVDLALLILIPPATLAYDTHAQPPVYAVKTSIEIAASPDQVWDRIIQLSRLAEPQEWYFRAGLAYPTQARIEGTGPGATRYCDFSTGPVVETIEVWDAPRLLRFRVTQNPAPMREWSPYGEISPKHLHGYLISREGEFRLTTLPGNHTLLEGTSWYQHGMWPAPYWRLWSDAIIHRIHLRVFRQIKTLAEHS